MTAPTSAAVRTSAITRHDKPHPLARGGGPRWATRRNAGTAGRWCTSGTAPRRVAAYALVAAEGPPDPAALPATDRAADPLSDRDRGAHRPGDLGWPR